MGAESLGFSRVRGQPISPRQGLGRNGQANGTDNTQECLDKPGEVHGVQFESVNPFGELAAEDNEEPVGTEELQDESEEDELPRLPDRDEHGKKVIKDGPARLQKKREREKNCQGY